MFGKKKPPFTKFGNMILFAIFGAVSGVISGFLLGLLIAWLAGLVATTTYDVVPYEISTFLGMGFAALLGGVFGGYFGYKE